MDGRTSGLTPAELRNRQFDKKMRGYDIEQVDEVLVLAADALQDALMRVNTLSGEVDRLKAKVDQFERMETTIKDTLVTTQGSVDEIRKNAEKEAELIRREAEVKTAREMEMHERHSEEIKAQIEKLKHLRSDYMVQLKSLIKNHQEMVDRIEGDFEDDDES